MKTPRPLLEAIILAMLLPAVAGAVNAVGFFAVGTYTSHMSGTIARIGDELSQGHFGRGLFCAGMVVVFFAGAATATLQILLARQRSRARYLTTLLTQAATLAAYTLLTLYPKQSGLLGSEFIPVALLCFSMGLQNAMVTKLSGAVIRTTHLTGVVTDLGIETVRLVHAYVAPGNTTPVPLREHPEFKRLLLHASLLGSFLVGAITAPMVYFALGPATMFISVVVLVCLAIFDASFGIVHQHGHLTWHEHSDPKVAVHH